MLKPNNKTVFLHTTLSIFLIGVVVFIYYLAPNLSSVKPLASQPLEEEINYEDLEPAMKALVNLLFNKAIADSVYMVALSLNSQVHLAPFLAPHASLGPVCQIYLSYITHAR